MTFVPGTKLGPFEILAPIGAGGMGEVYRAHDPRVGRDVAIKVSSEQFTDRFTREIHAVAALNHSNVCTLYDVGPNYLVMELIEGPTLADRIKQGAIPLDESLEIARQIADALEAAHEKGIVHRDLKPGNIKIRPDGTVKVLDFGLAKVGGTPAVSSEDSPTLSVAQTAAGVLLGTAAYMSPEQARGKAVDKRADIWAFGVVFYEMLTGKQLFTGETVSDTLAAALKEEPDFDKVPAKVRTLLRGCLEKNPSRRLRDIGDAWRLLENIPESAAAKRPWFAWSVAALAVLFAVLFAFTLLRQKAPPANEPMRLQINFPDKVVAGPNEAFALSPDGRHLAFDAVGSDGVQRLWLRTLNSPDARPLLGTESDGGVALFWSPESRFVVFEADRKLKKIDISGGAAQTVCALSGTAIGGSWNAEGEIIFGSWGAAQGLMRVSASGGAASPLTTLDSARQEGMHGWPIFLPDGHHFLYFCTSDIAGNTGVYIGSLDDKPGEKKSRQLLSTNFAPVYVPSQDSTPGRLLFLRNQTLMVQSFDDHRLEPVGRPIPVAEEVGDSLNFGFFSASTNGVLIYRKRGSQLYRLTWYDRSGRVLNTVGEPGNYRGIALSPDGTIAAVSWQNPTQASLFYDIYLIDLATGKNTQLTFGKANSISPAWSPDGNRIIFILDRNGRQSICQKLTSGTKQEEVLVKDIVAYQTSWSSDGRFLLYGTAGTNTAGDLSILPLEGDRKPVPFATTEFSEAHGRFSPNMRWIAYSSDETDSNEIYIQGFSKASAGASWETGGKWAVSKGGGMAPRWRKDSKELYYRAPDGKVMAVEVAADTVFKSGTPKPLFQAPLIASDRFSIFGFGGWDVSPDGERFLLMTPAAENPKPTPFNVVLNWTSLLK